MEVIKHLNQQELEAGLPHIRQAPREEGTLEMIICRPDIGERKTLDSGELSLTLGLVGDNWSTRPSSRTPDKSPHPDMQLNIMNARAAALLAVTKDRWGLAGDQLYIDIDLTDENLPHGTQLAIGTAIIEVTDQPHNGCKKFAARFGKDAIKFVNSPVGKELHLRGINAKVIQPGVISVGDRVTKV